MKNNYEYVKQVLLSDLMLAETELERLLEEDGTEEEISRQEGFRDGLKHAYTVVDINTEYGTESL